MVEITRTDTPPGSFLPIHNFQLYLLQVAPYGFIQESSSHTGADGMELPFGQVALQPEASSAVDRGRIIQGIQIRTQASHIAAEVQQGISSRVVGRQVRGSMGKDDADLARRDLPYQGLEALSVRGTRGILSISVSAISMASWG